eukprot:COSAG05_NODE_109_length_18675_cov_6.774279_11_plen_30_part_00
MGGIGGIFNLYLYSQTLKLLTVTNVPYRY